ncbi:hypothetical protein PV04_09220 [Phialophora macrospora]|uniref:Uncharacterized protein n=1 Tax=Phialophora macrospora TaxID=1851006 RepID=A0A0D2F8C5_9EURO|nr:hypothetical protein PV04_09220 [Phialophora macrospora]
MVLKLVFSTTHPSAQPVIVELCTPYEPNGKDEVVNIPLQEASEFQCQIAVSGREQQGQIVHVVRVQDVEIGSETKHSEDLRGQPCTHVEPLDPQGREGGSWHPPQGCGSGRGCSVSVGGNTESLLLRAYLGSPSTSDATDKGIAARQPVAATPDPHANGSASMYQSGPVKPPSGHPPAARGVHLPCACAHPCPCAPPGRGAQPASHPGGCRSSEPNPAFVGMVGGPLAPQASEAELQPQPTKAQKIKRLRGIPLFVDRPDDLPFRFTATMDTGAERNVMTRDLAERLGLTPDPTSSGIVTVVNDKKIDSEGTVVLTFSLGCDATPRREIFDVVQKLGSHQALLCAELILDLGHLVRRDCKCRGPHGRAGRTGVHSPSPARL